jgi:hypothetical protein
MAYSVYIHNKLYNIKYTNPIENVSVENRAFNHPS